VEDTVTLGSNYYAIFNLLHGAEPPTGPYPESTQSNPYHPILFSKIYLNVTIIVGVSMAYNFQIGDNQIELLT
jgi:hypothetical protein